MDNYLSELVRNDIKLFKNIKFKNASGMTLNYLASRDRLAGDVKHDECQRTATVVSASFDCDLSQRGGFLFRRSSHSSIPANKRRLVRNTRRATVKAANPGDLVSFPGLKVYTAETQNTTSGGSTVGMTQIDSSYEATTSNVSVTPMPVPSTYDFSLGKFFERPTYVGTITVPAAGVATSMKPITLWVTQSVIADKLRYFRILRGKFHVRLDISLNPHYYGAAHVCLVRNIAGSQGSITPHRFLGIPGATMDFSVSNSVELSSDIITPGFGIDLNQTASSPLGTDNPMTLAVTTYDSLKRDDGVAVGTQLIKIYAWMTKVELAAPSMYSVASGPPEDAGLRGGLNLAPSLASYASLSQMKAMVQKIRGSRAAEVALKLGPVFAAALGFSKPIGDMGVHKNDPSNIANFGVGSGPDSAITLSIDPQAQLSADFSNVTTEPDPLALSFWYSLWGYVDNVSWATTNAPGDQLAVIPVTPTLCYSVGSTLIVTPLGYLGQMFSRWSGSLKIRLRCSATPYHRGRLLVAYAPNTTSITPVPITTITSTTENCVLDVASGFDKTFTVKWTSPYPYLATDNSTIVTATWAALTNAMNGTLRLMVLDPLVATVAGANLNISIWVSAGEDFDYQCIDSTPSVFSVAASDPAVPMAFDQVLPAATPHYFGAFDCNEKVLSNTYGERCLSLRPVLHRYSAWLTMTPTDATPATLSGVVTKTNWPLFPLVRLSPGTISTVYAGTVGAAICYSTPMTLIASCFAGFRGGVRHKVVASGVTFGSTYGFKMSSIVTLPNGNQETPTWGSPTRSQWDSAGVLLLSQVASQDSCSGSAMRVCDSEYGVVADLEIRSRLGYFYTNTTGCNSSAPQEMGFSIITVNSVTGGGSPQGPQFAAYSAIGEDFSFVSFCGVPTLKNDGPAYATLGAYA